MNMITSDYIKAYLADNFGKVGDFSANGREFIMPSIFVKGDWKKHFSMNSDTGLWQDFKTGDKGNFIKFYSIIENISYAKAEAELVFKTFFLEDAKSTEFQEAKKAIANTNPLENCELTKISLDDGDSTNKDVALGWMFLFSRGLFDFSNPRNNEFLVCTEGRYRNRLIIPFIKNDCLFYFQARALSDSLHPKYMNPSVDSGMRPSTVLYPFDDTADHVVICEGPLDAISLQRQGVNATCTMGSVLSYTQIDILKEFQGRIIIGYDNDEAGERGLRKADRLRREKRMPEFYVLYPPDTVKDWNEAHMEDMDLKKYLEENVQKYDFDYEISESLKRL